jgi:hypothetical protein
MKKYKRAKERQDIFKNVRQFFSRERIGKPIQNRNLYPVDPSQKRVTIPPKKGRP